MRVITYLAAINLLVIIVLWFYKLIKNDKEPNTSPIHSENIRESLLMLDSLDASMYRIESEKWRTRHEASEREILTAKGNDKAVTEKAQYSADVYVKNKNLANCDSAFKDCQRENETKSYSLAIQERMILEQDGAIELRDSEISRLGSVKDSLSAGWQAANISMNKASKRKSFGIGVMAGYGVNKFGLSPTLSFGIQYNIVNF